MTASTTDGRDPAGAAAADPGSQAEVFLLLGSNVDADAQLDRALAAIGAEFAIVAMSARCRSEATLPGAPAYQNQAIRVRCALHRDLLKTRLRSIETALGRQRPPLDPRLCVIDIDAIGRYAVGLEVWDTKGYSAAHAREPLAEIGLCPPPEFI